MPQKSLETHSLPTASTHFNPYVFLSFFLLLSYSFSNLFYLLISSIYFTLALPGWSSCPLPLECLTFLLFFHFTLSRSPHMMYPDVIILLTSAVTFYLSLFLVLFCSPGQNHLLHNLLWRLPCPLPWVSLSLPLQLCVALTFHLLVSALLFYYTLCFNWPCSCFSVMWLVFSSTPSSSSHQLSRLSPLPCNTPQYTLELRASDSLHEGNTTVKIRIKDINDLPPKFDEASYETTILEEDTVGIPKRILKVVSSQVTQLTQLT